MRNANCNLAPTPQLMDVIEEQSITFTQLIRLADDHLILGHRLSEWCGHAPILEEDLAMPNIALDLLGQARALFTYAGALEDDGRDEDALAYHRLERGYTNLLMCERSNGDFAHTIVRQLFFSVFMKHYWQAASKSVDQTIAAIAAKAYKEADYHVRHCAQWTIRLGDGTEESARRTKDALELLTPYVSELFESDVITKANAQRHRLPDPITVQIPWHREVSRYFELAKLELPDIQQLNTVGRNGGRQGLHSEEMGYLLAELQFMQRTYPDMQW